MPYLNMEQAGRLILPISDIQIQDVVFDVDEDKSPSPNDSSSGFFKRTWSCRWLS